MKRFAWLVKKAPEIIFVYPLMIILFCALPCLFQLTVPPGQVLLFPTGTWLEVKGLALVGQLIEIDMEVHKAN
jgi:hypothetical protein